MLLTITLFCILVLVMTFIEYRQYKTFLTPFNVMVWPFVIIVLYLLAFGWHRQYNPVSNESIAYIAVNVTIFWLAGQVIWFVLRGQQAQEVNPSLENLISDHRAIFLGIIWIAIAAGFLSFVKTGLIFGFNALGTESFQSEFRSGILGHIMILAYPSFILLGAYWLKNHGKFLFISLLLMALIVLANQVKYRIILLILPTIFFAFQSKMVKKIKIVNLIGIGLMIFVIFILAYFIGFSATLGFNRAVQALPYPLKAFEDYIVGGPIALGYFLKGFENHFSSNIIFTVPLNIYRFINGDNNYVNPIFPYFVPIASQFAVKNNTGTIFGTLYMCLGFYGSLIFMIIIGVFIYTVYNIALSKRGTILNLLSAHFLGILSVSFFSYYFSLLPLWETGLSMVITPNVAILIKKIFQSKT